MNNNFIHFTYCNCETEINIDADFANERLNMLRVFNFKYSVAILLFAINKLDF